MLLVELTAYRWRTHEHPIWRFGTGAGQAKSRSRYALSTRVLFVQETQVIVGARHIILVYSKS